MTMRKSLLTAALVLAALSPASAHSRDSTSTVEYVPPPSPGDIYTVIDFARAHGTAEATTIAETMGSRRRDLTVVPHVYCQRSTPAGIVVRFRHYTIGQTPLTLTTSGRIVYGPYQGDVPMAALHRCYQMVS
jgi:hypothetical protein